MIEIKDILSKEILDNIYKSENKNKNENNQQKRWILYIHVIPSSISEYDHNKYYVGITSRSSEFKRWQRNGSGYSNQKLFYRAICKYGWENIEHIVIARNLNEEDASNLEKLIISELKSNIPVYGYNIAAGGISGGGAPIKLARYTLNGNLIDVFSSIKEAYEYVTGNYLEYACSIGNASLNTDSTSSAYGYLWRRFEEEPLKKINPYIHPWRVSVLQYDLDGNFIKEWNSIAEAESTLNLTTSISNVCRGELNTAGGFQWIYKTDDIICQNIGSANNKHKKKKHIYVYDMDGNYISDYFGITTAFKELGINVKNPRISKCYEDITKNAIYGYRWTQEYYDKLPPLRLNKGNRPVAKVDYKTSQTLDIFPSVAEAAKTHNVSHSSIDNCCRHKKKRIKGYKWEYIENISINSISDVDLKNKYLSFIKIN